MTNHSQEKLLDRRIDSVFKRIFGDQAHKAPLIDLLNAIFAAFEQPPIVDLVILNPSLEPDMAGDKTAVLDLRAQAEDGRMINVEMQVVNSGSFIQRTLYYWSELYGESLHAGDDYRQLNRTIAINLLNFNLFPQDKVISLYQLRDSHDDVILTDLMQIYFVELPKLGRQALPERLQQWLRFITINDEQELKFLAETNPAIGEAFKMLNYISHDSEERMRHVRRKIALMDQKALERRASEVEQAYRETEQALQQKQQLLQSAEQALQTTAQVLQSTEQTLHTTEQVLQNTEQALQTTEQALQTTEQTLQTTEQALQTTEQALIEAQEKSRHAALSLLVRLITKRFGNLPEWAQSKLHAATPAQIESWAEKTLEAQTLEECLA